VAFAIRTNVAYDGNLDDDCPLQGHAISFKTQDILHIKVPIIYYVLSYLFDIIYYLLQFILGLMKF